RPIHNLVISNVPGPRFPLFLEGARLEAIYPLGPVMEGAGLNLTLMSYLDAIDFSFLVDAELVPDVWEMAHMTTAALEELLLAARAHRASQFPAAEAAPPTPDIPAAPALPREDPAPVATAPVVEPPVVEPPVAKPPVVEPPVAKPPVVE